MLECPAEAQARCTLAWPVVSLVWGPAQRARALAEMFLSSELKDCALSGFLCAPEPSWNMAECLGLPKKLGFKGVEGRCGGHKEWDVSSRVAVDVGRYFGLLLAVALAGAPKGWPLCCGK